MKLRFSSVIRLSAISFIALGLAACSSGSGVPLDAGVGGGGGGSGGGMGNSSGKTSDIPAAGGSSLNEVGNDGWRIEVSNAKTEGNKKVYTKIKEQLMNDGYSEDEIKDLTYKKNGQNIDKEKELSAADIPSEGLYFDEEVIKFGNTEIKRTTRLYDLPFSQIAGYVNDSVSQDGKLVSDKEPKLNLTFLNMHGMVAKNLLKQGTASYSGRAFDASNGREGVLSYSVNFDTSKGSGSITSLGNDSEIKLKEATLGSFDVNNTRVFGVNPLEGKAALGKDGEGYYGFVFYGGNDNDEIMGAVYDVKPDNLEKTNAIVGFGGKKESANSR